MKNDIVFLGRNEAGFEAIIDSGRWPLLKLHLKRRKVRRVISENMHCFSVAAENIDLHLQNFICPDYLLGITSKCLVGLVTLSFLYDTFKNRGLNCTSIFKRNVYGYP